MQKIFFAVLMITAVGVSTTPAQLIKNYGIKAGSTSTTQSWNWPAQSGVIANSEPQQGLDVGFFVEWFDLPALSAITEIHYTQKGSKENTNIMITDLQHPDGTGRFLSYSTRISYLTIPVLLKVRMNLGLFAPYLFAGPRFDYKLSSSSTSISYDPNKLDIGGTFGIGLDLAPILPSRFALEFRYSPTFQDCYSNNSLKVRNSSMEFLVALNF
ncbi:MAG: porin family protein [Ignavibacteriales bacterium]|nr:porin family protein [Ignavibacteriales bacterium]